ncbi:glutaredoxin domain-containing protein [Actinoplanes sp. N902-109]|uniref:glutaredoxin domain-containing protein n=1 Tax=Actinoplanes sp. (strain N902-109) TaxID=649831 RepID=UPI0003296219|nr:glutaredoxin domain-containing protein [Actinoplanes sp. N902-109]AGL21460.1 integral membrane protein [Actinoplanes sp. N902-109]
MHRRWLLSAVCLALGVVVAVTSGWPVAVVVMLLAVLASPLVFPRSLPAAEAQRRSAQDGRGIVYWRPGCPFCLRLRLVLGLRGRRLHWVDIWKDPAGAAAVRAVADGNETVPTVFLNGSAHVNPDPAWLRTAVRA